MARGAAIMNESDDDLRLVERARAGDAAAAGEALARRLAHFLRAAELPARLADCGVSAGIFPVLAEEASQQWTARFNPRPVTEADLRRLYEAAS